MCILFGFLVQGNITKEKLLTLASFSFFKPRPVVLKVILKEGKGESGHVDGNQLFLKMR